MRKLLLTVAFLAITISSASAAEMAPRYKAPPPIIAPVWSWTGFYGGIHVGGGWSDSTATVTQANVPGFAVASIGNNCNGVVGGGQIGYNWQFAPNWVLGIEGDISGTGIRNANVSPVFIAGGGPVGAGFNHLADRNIDWMASIRGRLGYAADRWLIYFTGGGAWADVNYRTDFTGFGFNPLSANKTLSGWVVGGGVEYAVTNNWTVRAEYLYYDFGDERLVNLSPVIIGASSITTFDTKVNVVRAGVNYKF